METIAKRWLFEELKHLLSNEIGAEYILYDDNSERIIIKYKDSSEHNYYPYKNFMLEHKEVVLALLNSKVSLQGSYIACTSLRDVSLIIKAFNNSLQQGSVILRNYLEL